MQQFFKNEEYLSHDKDDVALGGALSSAEASRFGVKVWVQGLEP